MCDQGHGDFFISKNSVARNLDTSKILIKGTRTPSNVYVLEDGLEHCYLRKSEEMCLWQKILGHISFSKLLKSSRMGIVHDLPNISLLENTI